ncbi:Transcription factor spt8 [Ascosphaera atra]|nr:Transcription factor spt8 [Ascosphaera atra]
MNGDMNGGESPTDSLFGGGGDSLFGDVDANGEADDMFGDVDFSKHLTNGLNGDTSPKREHTPDHTGAPERNSFSERRPSKQEEQPTDTQGDAKGLTNGTTTAITNGNGSLPHYDEPINHAPAHSADASAPSKDIKSDQVFLSASIDGNLRIWDRRQSEPVARINPKNTPPWCMDACWSPDGNYIYAGRRNGTVDEYSLHKSLQEPTRTFRFPHGSGAVSALQAMPNGRHLVCASHDILRLYDTQADLTQKHTTVPFLIIPGHRTGVVSQLYLDRACRFMLSAGGNRGWEGLSTEVLLGYEITSFQP